MFTLILLILAYTLGIATFTLQIVCCLKKIGYKETSLLTITILAIITATAMPELHFLNDFFLEKTGRWVSSLLWIGLAAVIPFNIHKERVVNRVKIRNRIVLILSTATAALVGIFYLKERILWAEVLTCGYLFSSGIYSEIVVIFSQPSFIYDKLNVKNKVELANYIMTRS
ncbi:MAG: hypothetical protein EHM45_04530 [Desulfobacteraceae bacterium]|nr:MAG: hypothetical protein EHM45_04530 [Desulfobacteraceae bacterium]